jgi:hypothetical protein
MEDRIYRTLGDTRFAINAFVRVDVEQLLALVEAFDGADDNAVGIFAIEARLTDDMGHETGTPFAAGKPGWTVARSIAVKLN